MEIIAKAIEMLAKSNEITLASVNENGYPIICALSKIKSEGIKKFWVATGLSSTKVSHFKTNSKASACFYSGGNSITLMGKVSVNQDY
ncbi:pyridoxamine 5'-phosphate oxidase family protein [Ruminiclostridium papyrosolvens DSM 2782]|uniref:pyridoxamine 5'-phosphate oxidase family protein n=1 Tax=Ruminiclostridium papyrosolvens TaxID=29362 RepID=UPI0001B27DE0|nr:pyridoxamine 5'-phosphate oxidase family protein [Ruminiclostridium papyrosolvens]WES34972.1 pyridoxamine 5'-phosphate oxidase family protein [Ruminiclostridium papyrosolvens DSM 2782]